MILARCSIDTIPKIKPPIRSAKFFVAIGKYYVCKLKVGYYFTFTFDATSSTNSLHGLNAGMK